MLDGGFGKGKRERGGTCEVAVVVHFHFGSAVAEHVELGHFVRSEVKLGEVVVVAEAGERVVFAAVHCGFCWFGVVVRRGGGQWQGHQGG